MVGFSNNVAIALPHNYNYNYNDPEQERYMFLTTFLYVAECVFFADVNDLTILKKMEYYNFVYNNISRYLDDIVYYSNLFTISAVEKEKQRRLLEQVIDVDLLSNWSKRKSAINSIFSLIVDKYMEYFPNQQPLSTLLTW
jgi:hypothetical protein